jgi:hypothetical protein
VVGHPLGSGGFVHGSLVGLEIGLLRGIRRGLVGLHWLLLGSLFRRGGGLLRGVLVAQGRGGHCISLGTGFGSNGEGYFMRIAWYWIGITWTWGRIGGFAVSSRIVCWAAWCLSEGVRAPTTCGACCRGGGMVVLRGGCVRGGVATG